MVICKRDIEGTPCVRFKLSRVEKLLLSLLDTCVYKGLKRSGRTTHAKGDSWHNLNDHLEYSGVKPRRRTTKASKDIEIVSRPPRLTWRVGDIFPTDPPVPHRDVSPRPVLCRISVCSPHSLPASASSVDGTRLGKIHSSGVAGDNPELGQDLGGGNKSQEH